ncbi:potassium channel family protein [Maliponia aquimaris]|uniref:Trk system potassium uptake protein TrkA n=1 Tax=Maliponia aquimaris TaxID=1673631 RepID=A0A238K0N6_9RHOB|nr:TrkA family potassium uptake protein [Maliponia aquimaris]SMX36459.1 Trk system potassium uptake protein TrkA [Maliponia aquimaris]
MRVTVLGASTFAIATIRQLIERGHEVVLIEQDRARLDALAETLDCGMIHGDGSLPGTLTEAFGDGADAFVALTDTDNVNILAAAVARSVGYPRVITQLTRTELRPIIDQLDLGETITPHESFARALVDGLERHDRVSAGDVLGNDLRLLVVTLPEAAEARVCSDLGLPDRARPLARIRGEEEVMLDPETELRPGDRLLLLVRARDHDRVLSLFSPPDAD